MRYLVISLALLSAAALSGCGGGERVSETSALPEDEAIVEDEAQPAESEDVTGVDEGAADAEPEAAPDDDSAYAASRQLQGEKGLNQ